MVSKSNNSGCGCFLMLLLLGGGGYWGYSYFADPSEQNEVAPVQQELSDKAADSAATGAEQQSGTTVASSSVAAPAKSEAAASTEVETPSPIAVTTPAEEPTESEDSASTEEETSSSIAVTTPTVEPAKSEDSDSTEAETPSPVAETTTPAEAQEPAPASDVDYAPESLTDKRLLCSYEGAEISSWSDEVGGDFSPYVPIVDNGRGFFGTECGDIPMLRRLTVFTASSPGVAPMLRKYRRTGKNTAEVTIYALMIPDATAALAISNVASSIDHLTDQQIADKIGQYFLDSTDTLKLTFTGENTAIAENVYCSGIVENRIRGISVRLETGHADAVEPDAVPENSGADYGSTGERVVIEDRSSLDPLIARMRALRCRHATSALYQRRLLTLLPLIRNGADVDITLPETKGNTALHYACGIGSLSITKWLLEHGANPNAVTDKGATPIMCVGSDNRAAIIQALQNYGATNTGGNHGGGQSSRSTNADEDYNAGLEWQFGRNGRSQNYVRAAECYMRAANAGHAAAQNNIGHFYHQGWGVSKDLGKAAYWYRLAALQGLPLAQSNYGTCLEFGWGVRANRSEAIEWYRKAARQGNRSGQRHLRRLGVSW